MDQGFTIFPEQASTVALHVDLLYWFLTAVTVFFSALIFGLVIFFAIKYRRRHEDEVPRPVIESKALELFYTAVPFFIVMVMFFWGAKVFFLIYAEPKDPLDIHVVGKQWMWKVQHPEGAREINELHVPVGRRVQLTLASQDVIHSFFVPAFRIKQDAVPGRYTRISFEATKPGTYRLFCAEYCGTQHSGMIGQVVVMEPEKYSAWLRGTSADEPPAVAGQRLFTSLQCITCHGVQAPSLAGLYGREGHRVLRDGREEAVTADEDYLRESILNSTAAVVPGYQPIMPSYRNQVSEDQLIALVAYIKSLKDANVTPGAPRDDAARPDVGGNQDNLPGKSPITPGAGGAPQPRD